MRDSQNIRAVEALGVDWMGFIFHPLSKRYVGEQLAYLPEETKRVGVFVNDKLVTILEAIELYNLNSVQLHGNESPEFCKQLREQGIQVIKAFGITDYLPLEKIAEYEGCCNYYIFDTQTTQYGGSGIKYDWNILQSYRGNTPFLLSGGIGPSDVDAIKSFSHPMCVGIDINSKFELSPANKNIDSIHQFIKSLKQ